MCPLPTASRRGGGCAPCPPPRRRAARTGLAPAGAAQARQGHRGATALDRCILRHVNLKAKLFRMKQSPRSPFRRAHMSCIGLRRPATFAAWCDCLGQAGPQDGPAPHASCLYPAITRDGRVVSLVSQLLPLDACAHCARSQCSNMCARACLQWPAPKQFQLLASADWLHAAACGRQHRAAVACSQWRDSPSRLDSTVGIDVAPNEHMRPFRNGVRPFW